MQWRAGLALAPRGLGLAVLGLTLQACEWYSVGLFRVPFSITMLVSSGITAVGLAWYAYELERHLALGLLGLLPVVGPAGALVALAREASGGSSRETPLKARVAHAFLIPLAIVLSYCVGILIARRVEVAKVSPDGSLRVQLVVFPDAWAYNYFLRMQRIGTLGIAWSERIYRSVDEPFGTRRVVWAKDGSRFVVLGPKYENKRPGRFLNGEKAYLTYDLTSGEIRCFRPTKCRLSPPSLDDLRQIEWAERIWPTPSLSVDQASPG